MSAAGATEAPGWYRRVQTRLLSRGDSPYDALVAARKHALLSPLRGRVLEIGPGAGANLRHFARGVHWIGVEPNPHIHDELRTRVDRAGLAGDVLGGFAEELPVETSSVSAVVCTLVLCSVRDQDAALREIRRVLRPGGTFVFVEHVVASTRPRRFAQRAIRPLWQVLGDGCHPARDTESAISRAGFARVAIERFDLPLAIIGPHIAGVATRDAGLVVWPQAPESRSQTATDASTR